MTKQYVKNQLREYQWTVKNIDRLECDLADIGKELQDAYNEGYEQARNDIKRWVKTEIKNTTAIMEVVVLEGILEDLFNEYK